MSFPKGLVKVSGAIRCDRFMDPEGSHHMKDEVTPLKDLLAHSKRQVARLVREEKKKINRPSYDR